MLLVSFVSYGQTKEDYIKDGFFYTTFESGVGEKIPVKFSLGNDFLTKITQTEVYKIWESGTFTDPTKKWGNQTHIETYLTRSTWSSSFYTKLGLKNEDSFSPILNSKGFIYVNDKNEVCFSFPFKAQNGYGNMIFSEAYYIETTKDGKKDVRHFISSN